ncbi:MAG: ABC transporter ATP-binding protein/permease [Oscillospiraceae bacterium]|nr:ABC transporter ATP-binding protein/permease [Oscillospiraceae bacterium]
MIKILKYLKPREWVMAFICIVFIVTQVWLDLRIPEYMAEVTTLVQTPGSALSDIWRTGGNMLIATLGGMIAAIIIAYFAATIGAGFSRSVRSLLFEKVESFSKREINEFSTDSLITRSTNDITQVQMLIVMGLQLLIRSPIMAVWALSRIVGQGFEWTLTTAIAILVLVIMVTILMVFALPKFRIMQKLTDNMNRVTRENLTGLRVVRAYNAENYQEEKFEEANDELTATQLFTSRAMAVAMPVITLTISGVTLAIYWIGAFLINAADAMDRLDIFANMVVFSAYAVQVIMSFMMLVMIFIMLPRASVAAQRIQEVLGTELSIFDGAVTQGEPGLEGEVIFKNVSFKYPDAAEYMLRDISFEAKKGETVAFIGSTGSGKSTVVNLVPRFFDVTDGEILVGGVDIRDYTQESLRSKIGYVPQKATLFSGTISSNVGYGDNGAAFSEDDIKNAVTIAQSLDFVENMDGAFEAEISQDAKNISGGQKQRLSIARAVAWKPEIYIFDDSFSALDYKTDRVLRSALKKETAGVTSLIVAQRIGTIMDADLIIVLDEGRIVGRGRHRELLESCEVYRQIAAGQLSEEEL